MALPTSTNPLKARSEMSRFRFLTHLLMGLGAMLFIAAPFQPAMAQVPEGVQSQTGPRLDFPAGLASDGRLLYVANSRNNTIVAIDLVGHSLQLIAGMTFKDGSNDGTGDAARFNGPDGMAFVSGSLYICDTNNSDIRKVDTASHTVTTFAGTANISGTDDGHAAAAHFNLPTQIATDGSSLFVADSGNNTIRRIVLADGTVKTIAGQAGQQGNTDGPPSKSSFSNPSGIATDGKNVYVSDTGNQLIRKIDLSSSETSILAGTGEQGSNEGDAAKAQFNNPGALCTDGTFLYVLDSDNHAIRKINLAQKQVSTLTQVNGHIGSGCALTPDGKTLYISDTTENAVEQVDTSNGNFISVYPVGQ
jgi:sugar lactone lactonase YvrE